MGSYGGHVHHLPPLAAGRRRLKSRARTESTQLTIDLQTGGADQTHIVPVLFNLKR